MAKSPDAFRTISEVADWLGVQAHVLRFWESKFSQVKPVKRAGGRRYYRPNDMLLLGGIRRLLHEDGLTIKGVQKLLREEGISHVASLSQPLDDLTQFELDAEAEAEDDTIVHVAEVEEETGVVLNFETPPADDAATAEPDPVEEAQPEPETTHFEEPPAAEEEREEETAAAPAPPPAPESLEDPIPEEAPAEKSAPEEEPAGTQPGEAAEQAEAHTEVAQTQPADPSQEEPDDGPESNAAALPAFLRRPMAEAPETDNPPVEEAEEAAEVPAAAEPSAPEPPTPKPRVIDMPPVTPLDQIDAGPGVLTAAMRAGSLTQDQARQIAPLLARLSALRDSMAARRRPGPSD